MINTASGPLNMLPSLSIDGQFWGLGVHSEVFSGRDLAQMVNIDPEVMQITASVLRERPSSSPPRLPATSAARTNGHCRPISPREELMAMGRQILASLIAEQVAYHNYTPPRPRSSRPRRCRASCRASSPARLL